MAAINDRDPEGAIAGYVGSEYIQHNPDTPNGPDAFIRSMHEMFARAPEVRMQIRRAVAEGDRRALGRSPARSGTPCKRELDVLRGLETR
jgi:predicted SnoaL-like aldol condensation-catalyzing enzyme